MITSTLYIEKIIAETDTNSLGNLKKVVPNLVKWTAEKGQGYGELAEVYRELGYLWWGYNRHVIDNVGGVYETRKTADQEGVIYECACRNPTKCSSIPDQASLR